MIEEALRLFPLSPEVNFELERCTAAGCAPYFKLKCIGVKDCAAEGSDG